MHKRRNWIMSILAWFIALVPLGAQAATFCVNSAAGLQAALTTAGSNGQNDQIDIVAGNYSVVPGGFQYYSNEANSITIFGGFTAGCLQLTTAHTTLNAGGLYQVMQITIGSSSTAASVNIERITFIDGMATTEGGGGLEISAQNGDVRVEYDRFLLNHADNFAGGLFVNAGGQITVRNNLLFGNSALNQAAMTVQNGSSTYVTGNTVYANTATTTNGIGGLHVSGTAGSHIWLSNNILWNNNANGAVDLYMSSVSTLNNNDVGTYAGALPDPFGGNNQNVDPQFAPCGGILCAAFNLLRTSPLVDAGFDAAPGGLGSVDIEDKPRKIGPHIDIGAFEEDVLFANGFD